VKVTPTALRGVLIIEPDVHADARGFFMESYNRSRYAEQVGLDVEFVQDNHSHSKKNVLRGLHLQRRFPQGKLIRVVTGHVWDVAVDVDPTSPTFRRWVGVDLSDTNHLQLYIPPGYAHGFCVLSDYADLEYKCTQLYRADDEQGVLWSDPELDIRWPVAQPMLSARDASNPPLRRYLET
jgi:dTDP-4-dehydrorhamnose 3,5-epimerase